MCFTVGYTGVCVCACFAVRCHPQPFRFEGNLRMRLAEEGLRFLSSTVDTLIVIPNQNLFQMVDKKTSLLDSFRCGCSWSVSFVSYRIVS